MSYNFIHKKESIRFFPDTLFLFRLTDTAYLNIELSTSPVHDKGFSTSNKRRIVAAVFTVLLGSVILNPLRIPGPVIPQGTIISFVLTPPCPYSIPP